MSKGEQTREAVLREALAQSSQVGLGGISIGGLADALGMSKSGLFAHFRSKEQLQLEILRFAADRFRTRVLFPALAAERGEPRLRTAFDHWLEWDRGVDALPGGCVFVTATTEFDDAPDGPVRQLVVQQQQDWLESLEAIIRSGVTHGRFRADADPVAVAHDLYGVMLAYHTASRLLRDPAAEARARSSLDRLIADLAPQSDLT